jgi:hypothetical protein
MENYKRHDGLAARVWVAENTKIKLRNLCFFWVLFLLATISTLFTARLVAPIEDRAAAAAVKIVATQSDMIWQRNEFSPRCDKTILVSLRARRRSVVVEVRRFSASQQSNQQTKSIPAI